jgi:hypothetical protein
MEAISVDMGTPPQVGTPRNRDSIFLAGARDLFLLKNLQTGSGARPDPLRCVPEAVFPREKRQGGEADHSPVFSTKVKKVWSCTSNLSYGRGASWRGA